MKLFFIGVFVLITPIIAASISALVTHTSIFNEGTGSGTYLWMLLLTIPISAIVILIAVIRGVLKRLK